VAPDDEIPSGAKTVEASDVDPTLTIKRKAESVKPAAPPSKPAPVRAKKKKRTAA